MWEKSQLDMWQNHPQVLANKHITSKSLRNKCGLDHSYSALSGGDSGLPCIHQWEKAAPQLCGVGDTNLGLHFAYPALRNWCSVLPVNLSMDLLGH